MPADSPARDAAAWPDQTARLTAFVRANTRIEAPPLVPELRLHLASEFVPLWQSGEAELSAQGLPAPFWAFAWAGGQALARYLLDHPQVVAGKGVLDFAAGSGLLGIAAMQAGAAAVDCAEIDAFACAAISLNAAENGVEVTIQGRDIVGVDGPGESTDVPGTWDVILAGDVCYEEPMAGRVVDWLRRLAAAGALVLIGDPGRTYLPRHGLERVIAYGVKTSRELEDTDLRNAVVWRLLP